MAALGFIMPHIDPNEHSFDADDIMAATCKPVALLLSASMLPLRCSRFLLVVLAFVLSFLVRYGLTESAPFLADVAVIFSVSLFACWSLIHRDRLLLQLVIAEQASEEHQTKRSEVTEQAKTHKLAAMAFRSLLRHHTDAVLTVTERLTIAQSSPSLDNFFGQEMEGRPLHSVIPSLEHPQIMEAFQEVFVRRGPVEVNASLPRGPARLVIESSGQERPLFLVAIVLQDRESGPTQACAPEECKLHVLPRPFAASKDIKIPPLFPSGILKKEESDGHTLAAMLPGHSCPRASQPGLSPNGLLFEPLVHAARKNSSSGNSARSSLQSRKDKDTWKHSDELLSISITNTDPLSMSEHCSNEKKKEEKEIQVSIGTVVMEQGIAQSVQTEFTWSDEGMTCYHCLMARPPRPPSAEGRGSSPSRPSTGSRRVRRNSSRVSLRNADDAKLAAVWSGSLPRPVLMLPNFEKTSPKYVVRSLAQLMNQWNLEYPSGCCCKYHAVASLVVFLLRSELSQKCKPSWTPNSAWQCSTCGFMHQQEDFVCNLCGFVRGATSREEHKEDDLDGPWLDHGGTGQAEKSENCMSL